MRTTKNLVVAFGGISPEHEVSVITAIQAINALKDTSYNIVPLYISKEGEWFTGDYLMELEHYKDLDELKSKAYDCTISHDKDGMPILRETRKRGLFRSASAYTLSCVLIAFHGSDGENGAFQGLCEFFNIPYTGSGVLSSSLGMDKVLAKQICRLHEIPVVPDVHFTESDWNEDGETLLEACCNLAFPLIVKPVHLGSSIGVQQIGDRSALIEAVETSFRYDNHLMVEKAVHPLKEINCSVMGYPGKVETSVCERPKGKTETLTFEDKYQAEEGDRKGMAASDRVIPADIPQTKSREIRDMASTIFTLLGASGVARLDFLMNEETGSVYFNEINTIPGSFSFYLWEDSGYSFREILLKMIDIAYYHHQQKNGRVRSYETNLLSQKAVKGIKGLKGRKSDE